MSGAPETPDLCHHCKEVAHNPIVVRLPGNEMVKFCQPTARPDCFSALRTFMEGIARDDETQERMLRTPPRPMMPAEIFG